MKVFNVLCTFFSLCQIANGFISQKLFLSAFSFSSFLIFFAEFSSFLINEWLIPYLNANLCEWYSFF